MALEVQELHKNMELNKLLQACKPYDQQYIEMLHQFDDCEVVAFFIHILLQVGKAYGLPAGSWVGPYVMGHLWEVRSRCKREEIEEIDYELQLLPMVVYVSSSDEDEEQYTEFDSLHCSLNNVL